MKPLNILLADESKSVGQFVTEYLRSSRHQFTYVESGEAAVAAYREQTVDLVLMDVVLSGIGGLEAVKQIKAIATTVWAGRMHGVLL
jgi:CheY-like chemotaxis protein